MTGVERGITHTEAQDSTLPPSWNCFIVEVSLSLTFSLGVPGKAVRTQVVNSYCPRAAWGAKPGEAPTALRRPGAGPELRDSCIARPHGPADEGEAPVGL